PRPPPLPPPPALAHHVNDDPEYLRGYFWADGTIRVSSRDYSGMIESKCMTGGKLWCGSCHSLHESDSVNLPAQGKDTDAACLSCHPAIDPTGEDPRPAGKAVGVPTPRDLASL